MLKITHFMGLKIATARVWKIVQIFWNFRKMILKSILTAKIFSRWFFRIKGDRVHPTVQCAASDCDEIFPDYAPADGKIYDESNTHDSHCR